MAVPTIVFNNGTGSDTAASGAPSSMTAISGTAASFSGSVVTLDGSPSLASVTTDGTSVLWMLTSTGRQFFTINAKDDVGKTVTVDDAPAGTATGRTWGIGGKRKTVGDTNSRLLFSTDAKAGWTITLEDDQPALTTELACTAAGSRTTGLITFQGDDATWGNQRLLTSATNNISMISGGLDGWHLKNLKFTSTAGTKTSSYGILFNASNSTTLLILVTNCIFGDATNKLQSACARSAASNAGMRMKHCEIKNCLSDGIGGIGGTSTTRMSFDDCYVHDNAGWGSNLVFTGTPGLLYVNCIFAGNGSGGVLIPGVTNLAVEIRNCTFDNNAGDGVQFQTSADSGWAGCIITNNIFSNNSGYGVNPNFGSAATNDSVPALFDYNCYYNNTSGTVHNASTGAHDQIAVNPQYTNAAGGDYSIGTNLKAKGYPDSTLNVGGGSATKSYVDIGAAQRQEQAASPPISPTGLVFPGVTVVRI